MSIHPEDALAYAEQLTLDLNRIGRALERIADTLEHVDDDGRIKVAGLIVPREDRP